MNIYNTNLSIECSVSLAEYTCTLYSFLQVLRYREMCLLWYYNRQCEHLFCVMVITITAVSFYGSKNSVRKYIILKGRRSMTLNRCRYSVDRQKSRVMVIILNFHILLLFLFILIFTKSPNGTLDGRVQYVSCHHKEKRV